MMYLGWYGKRNCAVKNLTPNPVPSETCPDASWFWLSAALIAAATFFKGNKRAA